MPASVFDTHALHLSPVQRAAEAAGLGVEDPDRVHAHAARGVSGPATALPHGDVIQRAFGPDHDLSNVQAHVGGPAADASEAIGATAYATGNHIAFAKAPDLHTAAHEAAHHIQQRAGVSLKGGVGQSGDPYEQHADAVADRVVRGESAADLLTTPGSQAGPPAAFQANVQRQAHTVDVQVTWSSPFGADFTGTVELRGSTTGRGGWVTIDTKSVVATNTVSFAAAPYYTHYEAFLDPADDVVKKDPTPAEQAAGQFKNTSLSSGAVPAGAQNATISGRLELNRWNHENVRQRHASRGLDPTKTDESRVRSHDLFGRRVRVHDLLAPRVAATDALFKQLSPTDQAEIEESIFVMGGYAYRNQVGRQGHYSNHSVGTAIDVNYNEGKMQNALMETPSELRVLKELFETIARLDPAMAQFDVWKSKGQDQLEASKAFNRQFPLRLAELLGRTDYVNALNRPQLMGVPLIPVEQIREMVAADLVRSVTPAMIDAALKTAQGQDRTTLQLIKSNWRSLSAWVLGTEVTDEHAGEKDPSDPTGKRRKPSEKKTATGMIPLDKRVLQLFLDAGWTWGGDWGGGTRKDYMHFEDPAIEPLLKI